MSGYIMVALLGMLVLWCLIRRVDVLHAFIAGAAHGLSLLGKILPSMAAMLMLVNLLQQTGLTDRLVGLLSPLCTAIGLDGRLLPLLLLRPLSGSGATAITAEIYRTAGPDSLLGVQAGAVHASMETVFYTMTIYFGSVAIRKTRYAAPLALLVTLIGGLAALLIAKALFP